MTLQEKINGILVPVDETMEKVKTVRAHAMKAKDTAAMKKSDNPQSVKIMLREANALPTPATVREQMVGLWELGHMIPQAYAQSWILLAVIGLMAHQYPPDMIRRFFVECAQFGQVDEIEKKVEIGSEYVNRHFQSGTWWGDLIELAASKDVITGCELEELDKAAGDGTADGAADGR